jgi:hypothetical protein
MTVPGLTVSLDQRASEDTTIPDSLRPRVPRAQKRRGMYTHLYTLAEPFQAESYQSLRNRRSDFEFKNAIKAAHETSSREPVKSSDGSRTHVRILPPTNIARHHRALRLTVLAARMRN